MNGFDRVEVEPEPIEWFDIYKQTERCIIYEPECDLIGEVITIKSL